MSAQGGQTLAGHAASPSTLEKITDQGWNFVVLQEQSKIPAIAALRSEQMAPAVRLLDGKIAETGADTVLFLTWAGRDGLPGAGYEDYAAMQAGIEAGYLEVAGEIGALVAPAGVAWQRALERDPAVGAMAKGRDPSLPGRDLSGRLRLLRDPVGAEPRGSELPGWAAGGNCTIPAICGCRDGIGRPRALEYALMALPAARCGVATMTLSHYCTIPACPIGPRLTVGMEVNCTDA